MHFSLAIAGLALLTSTIATPTAMPELLPRTSCSVSEGKGTCMSTKSCSGFSIAGACPGGADNQCCVQKTCSAPTGSGHCLNKSAGCSGGSFVSGHCPGPASVQCCVKKVPGVGASCTANGKSGTCGLTSSSCSGGSFVAGHCPGASNVQCCVKSSTSGGGGNGHINNGAIKMLEGLEGFRANFYTDATGHKTIGYGHNCDAKGDCGSIHAPLSKTAGETLFRKDLKSYEACVCKLPHAKSLTDQQFGALVSFAYNSGCGGVSNYFKSYMTKSDFKGICKALPHTNTLSGLLTSRRKKEGAFCSQPSTKKSGC